MTEPVIYIDRSRVRPGKLDDLKRAIHDLVEFIDTREPQLLHYGFYFDETSERMTVIAVHPNPASVELHMEIGTPAFRGVGDLIEMEGIEIYGEPSDRMLEQLQQKVEMLGEHGRVVVDRLDTGFTRIGATTTS